MIKNNLIPNKYCNLPKELKYYRSNGNLCYSYI